MRKIFILLLCILSYADANLKFVVQLSRHGARNSKTKDIYNHDDPMGLTAAGMRQHYIMGRGIADQYIKMNTLLHPRYIQDEILIRCSQKTRTIASLYAELAGIYIHGSGAIYPIELNKVTPPNKANYTQWINEMGIYPVNYGWPIIPIKSIENSLDIYLNPQNVCTSINNVVTKYKKNHKVEIENKEKEFKSIYNEYIAKLKLPYDTKMNITYLSHLRDGIICGMAEGKFNASDEMVAKSLINLGAAVSKYLKFNLYLNVTEKDYVVSKIIATPFLTELKDNLINAAYRYDNQIPGLKYILNLASDTLIHAIMAQLGINKNLLMIEFASSLFFKLERKYNSHDENYLNNYFVELEYNESSNNLKYNLTDFIKKINEVTYDNATFTKYCYAKNPEPIHDNTFLYILFATIAYIVAMIILIIIYI